MSVCSSPDIACGGILSLESSCGQKCQVTNLRCDKSRPKKNVSCPHDPARVIWPYANQTDESVAISTNCGEYVHKVDGQCYTYFTCNVCRKYCASDELWGKCVKRDTTKGEVAKMWMKQRETGQCSRGVGCEEGSVWCYPKSEWDRCFPSSTVTSSTTSTTTIPSTSSTSLTPVQSTPTTADSTATTIRIESTNSAATQYQTFTRPPPTSRPRTPTPRVESTRSKTTPSSTPTVREEFTRSPPATRSNIPTPRVESSRVPPTARVELTRSPPATRSNIPTPRVESTRPSPDSRSSTSRPSVMSTSTLDPNMFSSTRNNATSTLAIQSTTPVARVDSTTISSVPTVVVVGATVGAAAVILILIVVSLCLCVRLRQIKQSKNPPPQFPPGQEEPVYFEPRTHQYNTGRGSMDNPGYRLDEQFGQRSHETNHEIWSSPHPPQPHDENVENIYTEIHPPYPAKSDSLYNHLSLPMKGHPAASFHGHKLGAPVSRHYDVATIHPPQPTWNAGDKTWFDIPEDDTSINSIGAPPLPDRHLSSEYSSPYDHQRAPLSDQTNDVSAYNRSWGNSPYDNTDSLDPPIALYEYSHVIEKENAGDM